ncbi:hypothetical protein FKM82_017076 [Ascaphus truei]
MNSSAPAPNCSIDHDIDHYLFPIIYVTVIVIGIPANCASLYISYLQVRKRNELGIYLFNLSVADLLYIATLPLWVDFTLHHDNWRFSESLCSFSAFLMHTNIYSSAGFLTCVSLDRYLAVVYPLRFYYLRTRRTAVLVSLIVWAVQSASNVVILLKDEMFMDNTTHLLCYDTFPMEPWKAVFSIINVCFGHVLPLSIIVFCYYRIYVAVKHNQATGDSDKKKIRHLLFTIVVTFILSFTPYHVVLLMRSIGEPGSCEFAQWIFRPYKVSVALSSINCIADPLLYCFVSEAGKADMRSIAYCCVQPNKTSGNQEYKMSATVSQ